MIPKRFLLFRIAVSMLGFFSLVGCQGEWIEGSRGSKSNSASAYKANFGKEVDVKKLAEGSAGKITYLASGKYHTCAVIDQRVVKCWGRNDFGQLGVPPESTPAANSFSVPSSSLPVEVKDLSLYGPIQEIALGNSHTCALINDPFFGLTADRVFCWGKFFNQKDNPDYYSEKPTVVEGLNDSIEHISAGGEHTCALKQNGRVACWGRNGFGQLGVADRSRIRYSPVDVLLESSGSDRAIDNVYAGAKNTCVLFKDHSLKCFGGIGTAVEQDPNTPVTADSLAIGSKHACAKINNWVTCWGDNSLFQLGYDERLGAHSTRTLTGDIPSLEVQSIASNSDHTCAVFLEGIVGCWGKNNWGQLGNEDTRNGEFSYPSNFGKDVKQVVVGDSHTCVLYKDGSTVKCLGSNEYGQLGNGGTSVDFRLIPDVVRGLIE